MQYCLHQLVNMYQHSLVRRGHRHGQSAHGTVYYLCSIFAWCRSKYKDLAHVTRPNEQDGWAAAELLSLEGKLMQRKTWRDMSNRMAAFPDSRNPNQLQITCPWCVRWSTSLHMYSIWVTTVPQFACGGQRTNWDPKSVHVQDNSYMSKCSGNILEGEWKIIRDGGTGHMLLDSVF